MQSLCRSLIQRESQAARVYLASSGGRIYGLSNLGFGSSVPNGVPDPKNPLFHSFHRFASHSQQPLMETMSSSDKNVRSFWGSLPQYSTLGSYFTCKSMSTVGGSINPETNESSAPITDAPPRIKFKRLDKAARNIMRILDEEAVQEVKSEREIPDIRPGYIVQMKVEVPENKRRISTVKGIVIARRNAGLNTTIRIRRQVAGVGVESLFPLYSPNIKEVKVLDKKKVRRAKLYYLREKMGALNK